MRRGKFGFQAGRSSSPFPASRVLFQACGGADAYGSDPYDAGADVALDGDSADGAGDPVGDEDAGGEGGGEGGAPDQTQ
jgi:hypothetical protein